MSRALLALLAAILAALLSLSVSGSAPAADARERVALSAGERSHLQAGMRAYLESVQGVVEGLAEHKMAKVAKSAAKSGEAMLGDIPAALALKLPPTFVAISLDTHRKFDELAKQARETRTKLAVTKALNDVLVNCTACHAAYKF